MIEIKNVRKKIGKNVILKDLSLTIKENKISAILGLNATGKSTLFKMILGLSKVDKGEILIDGRKLCYKDYEKIALITDLDSEFTHMTIKESFIFQSKFYNNWKMTKAYDMLKDFKLKDDMKIINLSKGSLAKLKLILEFAREPKYLLLDEPFSGIDIFTRESFIKSMIKYLEEDTTIVIITHEIKEIENVVEEIFIIKEGELRSSFNVDELREEEGISVIDKLKEVLENEITN